MSIVVVELTACGTVDRFGSRIYDHNLTSQDVMNKEILINIIRASQYQSLNFMVITQLNGGQSETLTTGLPTITFGPAQTIAQRQFPISNSLSSGATGSYVANPLLSSQFQQGMLSPVTPKTLAYLLGDHDRDTVFHLVVDSLNITIEDKITVRYINDPENDNPKNDKGFPGRCDFNSADRILKNRKSARSFLLDDSRCNYSKFANFLKVGLDYGVSAELVPAPPASRGQNGAVGGGLPAGAQGLPAGTSATPQATGHVCWDPGLAKYEYKSIIRETLHNICGENQNSKNDKDQDEQINDLLYPYSPALGGLRFQVQWRSPAGIFSALGKLLRGGSAERTARPLPSQHVFDAEPLLTIKTEDVGDCYVLAEYEGQSFCVPQYAHRTAMVMNVLQELKNLSITPSDLNSAFSVRVVN